MEAQITAGMKTPVLGPRAGPEGSAGDKGRKRESEPLSQIPSTEKDEQVRLIHFVLFENVKPQNAALYVGQEEITSFVLLPLCIKKVSVFEFLIKFIVESQEVSRHSFSADFKTQLSSH